MDKRIRVAVFDAGNTKHIDDDGDVSGTARAEQVRNILIKYME